MTTKNLNRLIFGMILSCTGSTASAAELHSHSDIKQAVNQFLLSQHTQAATTVRVEVGKIDTRLKFTRCEENTLETFMPNNSKARGSTTVGVRCAIPKPWTLYVRAKVKIMGDVVVTSRNLSNGESLSTDDVSVEERDLSQIHKGYFTSIDEVLGQVSSRSLRAGSILTPAQVKPAKLVKRGDQVTIKAGHKGFIAKMKGEAMSNGIKGQSIKVKNLASKRVIQATVTAPGLVEVQL